eukprot:763416-Hanusia_phi.AAC.5
MRVVSGDEGRAVQRWSRQVLGKGSEQEIRKSLNKAVRPVIFGADRKLRSEGVGLLTTKEGSG